MSRLQKGASGSGFLGDDMVRDGLHVDYFGVAEAGFLVLHAWIYAEGSFLPCGKGKRHSQETWRGRIICKLLLFVQSRTVNTARLLLCRQEALLCVPLGHWDTSRRANTLGPASLRC